MVWVEFGKKKPGGGVVGSGKMRVRYYFSDSEGSRTRAQRLGEMKVEGIERHFRIGGWCEEVTG